MACQTCLRLLEQQESAFLDKCIDRAEQEATVIAKENKNNRQRRAIKANHKLEQPSISFSQRSKNIGYNISSGFKQAMNKLSPSKHVRFAKTNKCSNSTTPMSQQ
jgi:methylphosphotriester-DNA--protein-cysteine methyltransferase